MSTKSVGSALPIAWTIQKWLTFGVILFTGIAAVTLVRRFEIMQVPLHLGIEEFPNGSYLLIDRDYEKGRPLAKGDWVLYAADSRVSLARVLAVDSSSRLRIQIPPEEICREINDQEIWGRVLMVLAHSRELSIPRHFGE